MSEFNQGNLKDFFSLELWKLYSMYLANYYFNPTRSEHTRSERTRPERRKYFLSTSN